MGIDFDKSILFYFFFLGEIPKIPQVEKNIGSFGSQMQRGIVCWMNMMRGRRADPCVYSHFSTFIHEWLRGTLTYTPFIEPYTQVCSWETAASKLHPHRTAPKLITGVMALS